MFKIFTFPIVITTSCLEFGKSISKYGITFMFVYILFILDCFESFMFAGIKLKQRFAWMFTKICIEISEYGAIVEAPIVPEVAFLYIGKNRVTDINCNTFQCQHLNKDFLQCPKEVCYVCICPKCRSINEFLPENEYISKAPACFSKETTNYKSMHRDSVSATSISDKSQNDEMESEKCESLNNIIQVSKKDGNISPESIYEKLCTMDVLQSKMSPRCQIILNDTETPYDTEIRDISSVASTFQTEICQTTVKENFTKFSPKENLTVPTNSDEFESIDLNSPVSEKRINLNRSCLRLKFEESPSGVPPERKSFFGRKWSKWIQSWKADTAFSSIARDGREDISSSITDYKSFLTNRGESNVEENNRISFLVKEVQSPVGNGCCCNMFSKLKTKLDKYSTESCVSYNRF